mmetsp:Transcript_30217/g.78119  ORF Transcript_30217/g.78119 Transcript_30217/m.78119 type:complete len:852 (+) Transcript_30217:306-2861(+)
MASRRLSLVALALASFVLLCALQQVQGASIRWAPPRRLLRAIATVDLSPLEDKAAAEDTEASHESVRVRLSLSEQPPGGFRLQEGLLLSLWAFDPWSHAAAEQLGEVAVRYSPGMMAAAGGLEVELPLSGEAPTRFSRAAAAGSLVHFLRVAPGSCCRYAYVLELDIPVDSKEPVIAAPRLLAGSPCNAAAPCEVAAAAGGEATAPQEHGEGAPQGEAGHHRVSVRLRLVGGAPSGGFLPNEALTLAVYGYDKASWEAPSGGSGGGGELAPVKLAEAALGAAELAVLEGGAEEAVAVDLEFALPAGLAGLPADRLGLFMGSAASGGSGRFTAFGFQPFELGTAEGDAKAATVVELDAFLATVGSNGGANALAELGGVVPALAELSVAGAPAANLPMRSKFELRDGPTGSLLPNGIGSKPRGVGAVLIDAPAPEEERGNAGKGNSTAAAETMAPVTTPPNNNTASTGNATAPEVAIPLEATAPPPMADRTARLQLALSAAPPGGFGDDEGLLLRVWGYDPAALSTEPAVVAEAAVVGSGDTAPAEVNVTFPALPGTRYYATVAAPRGCCRYAYHVADFTPLPETPAADEMTPLVAKLTRGGCPVACVPSGAGPAPLGPITSVDVSLKLGALPAGGFRPGEGLLVSVWAEPEGGGNPSSPLLPGEAGAPEPHRVAEAFLQPPVGAEAIGALEAEIPLALDGIPSALADALAARSARMWVTLSGRACCRFAYYANFGSAAVNTWRHRPAATLSVGLSSAAPCAAAQICGAPTNVTAAAITAPLDAATTTPAAPLDAAGSPAPTNWTFPPAVLPPVPADEPAERTAGEALQGPGAGAAANTMPGATADGVAAAAP